MGLGLRVAVGILKAWVHACISARFPTPPHARCPYTKPLIYGSYGPTPRSHPEHRSRPTPWVPHMRPILTPQAPWGLFWPHRPHPTLMAPPYEAYFGPSGPLGLILASHAPPNPMGPPYEAYFGPTGPRGPFLVPQAPTHPMGPPYEACFGPKSPMGHILPPQAPWASGQTKF